MAASERTSFFYHASALALSGHITRPLDHLIEVQAGTALPTTGGHGSARVENFRFDTMVSFKAGYSLVSGSEKIRDGKIVHTTLSTAVVEGLNILDVVTADRIVARLASSFEPGTHESRILVIGSKFENLSIAGCKIDIELHHEWALKLDTFEATRKEFETNQDFRKMAEDPFAPGNLPAKVEPHGIICCSIVKEVKPAKCPGVISHGHHGHVLVVPEFGKIFLAEVMFEHGRKTLTMLRVELGSPCSANVLAVQANSNGRPPGGP
jgi:hypothetical protein